MYIKSISLKDFKNLNLTLDFSDHLNIIVASNGTGKTNLIEAIHTVINGTSFRSYPEVNLINFNSADFARLDAAVNGNELKVIISRFSDGSQKRLLINSSNKSMSSYFSELSSIIFSPQTVDIIGGSPDIRRNDIDDFISSSDIKYKRTLANYKKVLRNRNKLLYKLKGGVGNLDELDFWSNSLVKFGSEIIGARVKLLNQIKDKVGSIFQELFSGSEKVFIGYQSGISEDSPETSFNQKIVENLDKEIEAGLTLYGPHRDDIIFQLDEKDARTFASRGQQRILALTYKIALLKKLVEDGKDVVLLLDDVLSELDQAHRENIQSFLKANKTQSFLTSSDITEFNEKKLGKFNLVELEKIIH